MGTLIKRLVSTCAVIAFCLLSCGPAQAGLITNGDFEAGDTGFTTAYLVNHVDLFTPKTYDVITDPNDRHGAFTSIGDHTSGSGLMYVANGALDKSTVWEQTISVTAGTTYDFSMWATSVYTVSPAILDVQFNGVSASGTLALPSTIEWREFTTTWSSGASTSLTIRIRDLNTIGDGNDFALDDISLTTSTVPEPSSLAMLTIGGLAAAFGLYRRRFATR